MGKLTELLFDTDAPIGEKNNSYMKAKSPMRVKSLICTGFRVTVRWFSFSASKLVWVLKLISSQTDRDWSAQSEDPKWAFWYAK